MKYSALVVLFVTLGSVGSVADAQTQVKTQKPSAVALPPSAHRQLTPIMGFNKNQSVVLQSLKNTRLSFGLRNNATDFRLTPMAAEINSANDLTCPTNKAGLTDGYQVFVYSLSSDAAASLSLFAKADISINDKVLLYYFMWYKDILDTSGANI